MSKPDDVPQDVWAAAERAICTEGVYVRGNLSHMLVVERCARAIMAEREACAVIVDDLAWVIQGEAERAPTSILRRASSAQKHAVETAAVAIRSRTQPRR